MKKHPVLKKMTIVAVILCVIFMGINGVWYFGYKSVYDRCEKKLEYVTDEDSDGEGWELVKDGYRYVAKDPSYLGEGGFLAVERENGYVVSQDENGKQTDNGVSVSLYIWPKWFGGYEYGVYIYSDLEEINKQLMITENMEYQAEEEDDDALVEENQKLIEQYSEQIQEMMEGAKELWEM